ncbi:FAD-binding oxidoreductase [Mycolicibacterium stellerae]|uniref:FAD-binding oxidoreductase n=1 Tax=Mycolicibacterium stellerae TaxID=2358193 RepID=UPI000F0B3049|nr:FAD-binding oxidoreductase [Mycolicibacterium stellerae]
MTREHKVALTFEGADRIDIVCRDDEDVITAALRQGYLLLSDCREGSCSTCRGFLVDGEYDQLLPHSPHALSDAEEDDGLILTCRLRPSSDLEIDFDYPADRVGRYEEGTRNGQIVAIESLSDSVARVMVRTNAAQAPLQWEAGQYAQVTLTTIGVTRAYSMANVCGADRELEFLIRLLPEGRFSGHVAAGTALGEPVRIRGPYGHFTFRGCTNPVFVAGGTGLAPVLAMLRELATKAPATTATLVFGAKTDLDLLCSEELSEIQSVMPYLDVIATVGNPTPVWAGPVGGVTAHLNSVEPSASFYLCGPPGLVSACEAHLTERDVPRGRIHAERFVETREGQQ